MGQIETTPFDHRWRRPASWVFAHDAQATCVDSLPIAAGGLHAKRHLSFKMGVFSAIEPPRRSTAPFGQKRKAQSLKFGMSFLKLPRLLSPKPTKHDMVLLGGTRFETARKNECNRSDGTAESTLSSESDGNNCLQTPGSETVSQTSFRVYRFYEHYDRAQTVHAGEHPFVIIAHPCSLWLKKL